MIEGRRDKGFLRLIIPEGSLFTSSERDVVLVKDHNIRTNGFPWQSFIESTGDAAVSSPLRGASSEDLFFAQSSDPEMQRRVQAARGEHLHRELLRRSSLEQGAVRAGAPDGGPDAGAALRPDGRQVRRVLFRRDPEVWSRRQPLMDRTSPGTTASCAKWHRRGAMAPAPAARLFLAKQEGFSGDGKTTPAYSNQ